jgi:hypothetical protein
MTSFKAFTLRGTEENKKKIVRIAGLRAKIEPGTSQI